MSGYASNCTLGEMAAALHAARRVVITTHSKPDGDAFGAVIALGRALELDGRAVERWVMPPLPEHLKIINGEAAPVNFHAGDDDPLPAEEPDAIVIADTGAWSQLDPMRHWLAGRRDRIFVIDHHLHGDDDLGARRYVDAKAAAVCEIIADLIDLLGCPYDRVIAEALYVGIASDTGWFRFSNTTPRTHTLAARLLALGVDHTRLYEAMEQSERLSKLLLIIRALESTQLLGHGRAALMTLRHSDFITTGAKPEETDRLTDIPQMVREVQLVALLTEVDPQRVRISFRSKPGPHAIDVNAVATRFGGGGHARAAGAKVDAPLDEVRPRLIATLHEVLSTGPDASPITHGGSD